MDQVLLALRVIVSLAIVIGLMWALSRIGRGRTPARRGTPLDIVSRTSVGKHGSILILRVGERGLVVGVTEQSMSLLAEIELAPEPVVAERRESVVLSEAVLSDALLSDAVLSDAALDAALLSEVSRGAHAGTTHSITASAHASGRRGARAASSTTLAGSVLSPKTWRDLSAALRERSLRA
jgi:flagellar protein FliO/FliZ